MIVTRPANACFRRDTAARRERFAPCVPHPARLTRSMSHAIAQCTRVAARRTVHASRAPRPSYPAPCQRSRESAANAKLPCRPFCDTEQRPPPWIGTLFDIRKFVIRNTPTRTSIAPDHRNFERGSPIRCVSVRIILCAHCKKLVAQTPRRPFFLLSPMSMRVPCMKKLRFWPRNRVLARIRPTSMSCLPR